MPGKLIAWIAALAITCAAAAQPLQKITVNYPTRSGASWPMYIAKEGGYYQKNGLDVDLKFGVHPAGIAMLVSGEAAMANYSLEQAMDASTKDGSFVMVGSSLNKALFALMAAKNFTEVKQLKGKRLAVGQLGDAPYNYTVALLKSYGLGVRDVQWIPVGTDVNGRVAALISGRADATLLTAPTYFKVEEQGYRNLANLHDHDDIFAATTYLMKKSFVVANPKLPELLIKAHSEAIKRFYEDKDFAVKSYIAYDKQDPADVGRFYDIHKSKNLFERVPYVMAGAVASVIEQQTDPQMITLMKGYDYRKVVDNSYVDRLVKEGYFEKLFGPEVKAEEARKAKQAFK